MCRSKWIQINGKIRDEFVSNIMNIVEGEKEGGERSERK